MKLKGMTLFFFGIVLGGLGGVLGLILDIAAGSPLTIMFATWGVSIAVALSFAFMGTIITHLEELNKKFDTLINDTEEKCDKKIIETSNQEGSIEIEFNKLDSMSNNELTTIANSPQKYRKETVRFASELLKLRKKQ